MFTISEVNLSFTIFFIQYYNNIFVIKIIIKNNYKNFKKFFSTRELNDSSQNI